MQRMHRSPSVCNHVCVAAKDMCCVLIKLGHRGRSMPGSTGAPALLALVIMAASLMPPAAWTWPHSVLVAGKLLTLALSLWATSCKHGGAVAKSEWPLLPDGKAR